jgi:amidohydrolase
MDTKTQVKIIEEEIIEWRRELHKIPETGLVLPETRKYICSVLEGMGVEFKCHEKTSGIEVLIRGRNSGKTIAVRSDMDALPINELVDADFKSTNSNMHACGHDAHMAMLLGTIKTLNENKHRLNGHVKCIFQPGEEGYMGARYMIEEETMNNPKVDAVLGLHVTNNIPELKEGKIGIKKGYITASSDSFKIKIIGKGGHGANPQLATDPILIGSHIVLALQNIVRLKIPFDENAVVTIGIIRGGETSNTIPDKLIIEGTARATTEKSRRVLAENIRSISKGITETMNGKTEIEYNFNIPPVYNDEWVTDSVEGSLGKVFAKDEIVEIKTPIMAGDDIACFINESRGTYIHLGCGYDNAEEIFPLHNPYFTVNESVLWKGTATFVQSAMDLIDELIAEDSLHKCV